MAQDTGNGRRLGDYELIERVSSGGEGTVYKARCVVDTNPNVKQGEVVAVKVLRHTGDDGAGRARYEREIKSFLTLSHPNIVQYKDSFVEQDEWGEDLRCMTVEFLHGSDLKTLISENPSGIPWERLRGIFVQTLEALCYACEKGIIHRDISPSNIFVEPDGLVKVIDFGIARRKDSETATTAGFKGKFDYMAPDFLRTDESFRGDEQSDVFSLGACFYEALTGRLPFSTERETGSVGYLSRWHQETTPEPINDLPVFRVMNDATTVFMRKALATDRSKRYATFVDMLADFDGLKCRRVETERGVYEFVKYLGKGGFGEVFKARRMADGEVFAVKHLFSGHDHARFTREARLLQEHAHPSIVRYEDFVQVDRLGGEDLYLILEFLDGMPEWSLRNRLREEGALEIREIRRLFAAYLDALHFLHTSHGRPIVHRDITPANLYAPPTESDQKPKIFDLGIARSEKTQTSGRVPGNPQYMAPELVLESEARGTPRSDVFNIGLCLYETACGRPAFGHLPRETMRMWNEVMRRVEGKVDVDFDLTVFKTYPQLKFVIERAIERNPEDRFTSAAEMREALLTESVVADETLAALPEKPGPEAVSPTVTPPPPAAEEEPDTLATWALGMEPPPPSADEGSEEPPTAATRAIDMLADEDRPPPPPPEPVSTTPKDELEPLPGLGEADDEEDYPETQATVGLGMEGAPIIPPPPPPSTEEPPARTVPPSQPRATDLPAPLTADVDEEEDFPETVAAVEPTPGIEPPKAKPAAPEAPSKPRAQPRPVEKKPEPEPARETKPQPARVPRPEPADIELAEPRSYSTRLVPVVLVTAAIIALAAGGWWYLQTRDTSRGLATLVNDAGPFEPSKAYVQDLRSRLGEIDSALKGNEDSRINAIRTAAAERWNALPDAFADAFADALGAGDVDKAGAIAQAWRDAKELLVHGDILSEQVTALLKSMTSRHAFAVRLAGLRNATPTLKYLESVAAAVKAADAGRKDEALSAARAWWEQSEREAAGLGGKWVDALTRSMNDAVSKGDAKALLQVLTVWDAGKTLDIASTLLSSSKRLNAEETVRNGIHAMLDQEANAAMAAYRGKRETEAVKLHQAFRELPRRMPELHGRATARYNELLKQIGAEQVAIVLGRVTAIAAPKTPQDFEKTKTEIDTVTALYEQFSEGWTPEQRENVEHEGKTHCLTIANALAADTSTVGLLGDLAAAVPEAFGRKDIARIEADWREAEDQIRDAIKKLNDLGVFLSKASPSDWRQGLENWRGLTLEKSTLETVAVQSQWEKMTGMLKNSVTAFAENCEDGAGLAEANEVLALAEKDGVLAAKTVSNIRSLIDVRQAVLNLKTLAPLLSQDDPEKLKEGLARWRNLKIPDELRDHQAVSAEWVRRVSEFKGSVLRYLGRCTRLSELPAVQDLLAGDNPIPGKGVSGLLLEAVNEKRDRLFGAVATQTAQALTSDVAPLFVADDPASWARGFAAWNDLGITTDLRSHQAVKDGWAKVEQTFRDSAVRFMDALQPTDRRDGLARVQTIVSGETARSLLGAPIREGVDAALKKHLGTFVLVLKSNATQALTVRLDGRELGVIEPGKSSTFTVEANDQSAALTCAGSAAYDPAEQSLMVARGGGQLIGIASLKARPRKLVLPELPTSPPVAATYVPTGSGAATPTAIGDATLLDPGQYTIAYKRPDYAPLTLPLAVEPGVDPVIAPSPPAWQPTAAVGNLLKLEEALHAGNMTVADSLIEPVSAGAYQWAAHRERAQQALVAWRKGHSAAVKKHWERREYSQAMAASETLAKVFSAAGRGDAAEVCCFNAALCRYLGQKAGSERRLQVAEDLLTLVSSSGVRAAAAAHEEREWVDSLKRKLGGYVKLRKSGSAFASMDEGATTTYIQARNVPFPLPD